jgi:hypothetical protein
MLKKHFKKKPNTTVGTLPDIGMDKQHLLHDFKRYSAIGSAGMKIAVRHTMPMSHCPWLLVTD